MKELKKENKKLKRKINNLASLISKLISPYFLHQNSTLPGKNFNYIYGKRGL